MTIDIRYLNREQVMQLGGLDMMMTVKDMEEMFRLLASGECVLPTKVVLRWGGPETEKTRGHINAMPGYVGGNYDMAGMKWISVMRQNPARYGLTVSSALTVLNDPIKGMPVALVEGSLISDMRTGAVSGVAAKYLARENSQKVALLGAGVAGLTHLMALEAVLPSLSGVLVFDVQQERSQSFSDEANGKLRMSLETATSPEDAVAGADVIVSMVSPDSPLLKRGSFPKGCLVLELGANGCELAAIPEFDKIVTDSWHEIKERGTQVLARAEAEGIISDEDIHADLGQVVAGKKAGREDSQERIIFGAVGMGIEDIAVATRILHRAEEAGVGTMLTLWESPAFR